MAKKKKYVPRKDDDWNEEAAKEHKQVIREKEKNIKDRYNKWWDSDKRKWKEGFDGH